MTGPEIVGTIIGVILFVLGIFSVVVMLGSLSYVISIMLDIVDKVYRETIDTFTRRN